MSPRYTNGKPVSPNVIECLHYLAKVGVMARETWYECFASGSKRWRQKQLRQLLELRIVKPHSSQIGSYFVLGNEGVKLVSGLRWIFVTPSMPHQFKHDETVARGLLKLKAESICNGWLSERELMSGTHQEFKIGGDKEQTKYPDAVFRILVKGKPRTVAIEYERRGKSSRRYRSILWSYNAVTSVSLVLFIVEDETIKKRISTALKAHGNIPLIERLAFMSVEEWRKDPFRAVIELRSKKTSFEKLLDKVAA